MQLAQLLDAEARLGAGGVGGQEEGGWRRGRIGHAHRSGDGGIPVHHHTEGRARAPSSFWARIHTLADGGPGTPVQILNVEQAVTFGG